MCKVIQQRRRRLKAVVNVTFTAAQTVGDLDVVVIGWNNSTATVSGVTDSRGNTYALAVGPTIQAPVASQSIYYAKNIAAAAAGANSVTVTFSGAAAFPDIRILEYKGADLNNPVDVTAANSGNSGTSNSGTATTTNATDLIFGANLVQTTTTGPGSGFTRRLLTSDGDIAEDRMVTAVGSYSATAPLSSGQWIMQMVAFRTPVSGGDTTPPSAPTNLSATANGTQINLSWTASSDNVGVTGYRVERCQGAGCSNFAQIGTPTATTYADTGLGAGTYSYRVRAADAAGNLSQYSNIGTASITGSVGTPTAPGNLTPTAGSIGPSVAAEQSYINSTSLSTHTTAPFDSSSGNLLVICASSHAGVTLTPRDNFGNTWIPIAGPTNTSVGLDLRTQVWYAWTPLVGAGHTVTMTLSAPQSLVISVFVVQGVNVSSPIDAVSLIGADNGTQSVNVTSPNITVTGANDLLIGFVKVSAGASFVSGSGFAQQLAASSNLLDAETAPAATAGSYTATFTLNTAQTWQSMIVAAAKSSNQTRLSWTAATESGGSISNYLVERCQGVGCTDFAQIGTAAGTTFNDTGLSLATSYSYRVRAQDTVNTLGPYSSVTTIATPAPVPSLPGNLTAMAASGTQINLSWQGSEETGGTVNSYLIERCQGAGCTGFSQIGTSVATTFNDTALTSSTSYTYRVRAQDGASNLSPYSNVASTPTAGAPTDPTNLVALAASSTQINLTWTASTEAGGTVTGYLVERCQGVGCSNFARVLTVPTNSFSDTGLLPSTIYTYRVKATDAAGLFSNYSNLATTMTPALGQTSMITYVQGNYSALQSSPTTVTVTFAAAQIAGDLNVVVVGWNNSTATVSCGRR